MSRLKFEEVQGRSAWQAATLARDESWIVDLSSPAIAELEDAGREILKSGRPLRDIAPGDITLPRLSAEVRARADDLEKGLGVVLFRGLPVARYSDDEIRAMYWALGTCLGVGVSQNRRGEYVGDVVDYGDPQHFKRPFQRGGELIMHRDPIDIVGLLCIRHAKSGGLSRIASSAAIHNAIYNERPELLAPLYEGFHYHRLPEDRGDTAAITPHKIPLFARGHADAFSAFFIPGPIKRAAEEGYALGSLAREALEFFVSVSKRPEIYFDMNLAPGDIQFLNNRIVLHGRTDYEDYLEPERRRFMLRLWLMAPEWAPLPENQKYFEEDDRCGGGIPPTEMAVS